MPSTGGCPVRMPRSPSRVLAITIRALPDQTSPSGATSSTRTVTVLTCLPARSRRSAPPGSLLRALAGARPRRSLPLQLRGLALDVLDPADHVERLLGEVVVLALDQRLERGHGVRQRHEHARLPGELLGHEHRVREEPLDPPGAPDGDLILFRELIDAEDGDDVLQLL